MSYGECHGSEGSFIEMRTSERLGVGRPMILLPFTAADVFIFSVVTKPTKKYLIMSIITPDCKWTSYMINEARVDTILWTPYDLA